MFKKIVLSEEKVVSCIDLLEIAKDYCENHYDKGSEINSLGTLLGVILQEQNELLNYIDEMAALKIQ